MSGRIYGYILLTAFCTMMLSNDFRRRFFAKDEVQYLIKSQSKNRWIYFLMGMTIPALIFLSAVYLKVELFTRILMLLISIEMSIIWGIIEFGTVIVTKTHVGKIWYTAYEQMDYYQIERFGKELAFVYKKSNKKRREMIPISQEDVDTLKRIMTENKVKQLL